MTICWRLQDIPELRGTPEPQRRSLWREAVTRSTTPRRMLASMALIFVAALAAGGASLALLPAISPSWVAMPTVGAAAFLVELRIRQPAARRWLREHAHELDRYVPA